MNHDKRDIRLKENQLDKALVKFNDLQSNNRNLRKEIDVMRKQLKNQHRVNYILRNKISQIVDNAKKSCIDSNKSVKSTEAV